MLRDPRAAAGPLHIGIVGFGRVVRGYYVPALRQHRGIDRISVADPLAASRAAARASLPRVTTHEGYETLLERQVDALLVASPPSTHLRIWNDASAAGVPVFMEKPFLLAGEFDQARRTPAAQRLLMVDFNRRFWRGYRDLRTLLREGSLGAIESAELTLHLNLTPWNRVTEHRLDPAEGGVLHDLGSHLLDLVAWLLPGVPASIAAESASDRGPGDPIRVRLTYPSGATATIDVKHGDRARESMRIVTTKGVVRLDDPNMAIHVESPRASRPHPLDRGHDFLCLGYRAFRRARSMSRASIAAALAAFFENLRTGSPPWPGFGDAALNLAWLDAATRALASGATVKLPPDAPYAPLTAD